MKVNEVHQSLSLQVKLSSELMVKASHLRFRTSPKCTRLISTEELPWPSTKIRWETPRPSTRLKSNCNKISEKKQIAKKINAR